MSPQLATTALVLAGLLAQVVPSWWQQRGVLTPGAEPDDYAALNQGQLKNLARATIEEMNHRLPPPAGGQAGQGAGPALNALLDSWANPGPDADNYATVTAGQLATLMEKFHGRLEEVRAQYAPGWPSAARTAQQMQSAATANQIVNTGQAKHAFAALEGDRHQHDAASIANPQADPSQFRFGLAWLEDQDGDGVPDFQQPAFYTCHVPRLMVMSGAGQSVEGGETMQQPVVLRAVQGLTPLANLPVEVFLSGDADTQGALGGDAADTAHTSVTLSTSATGEVSVWWKAPLVQTTSLRTISATATLNGAAFAVLHIPVYAMSAGSGNNGNNGGPNGTNGNQGPGSNPVAATPPKIAPVWRVKWMTPSMLWAEEQWGVLDVHTSFHNCRGITGYLYTPENAQEDFLIQFRNNASYYAAPDDPVYPNNVRFSSWLFSDEGDGWVRYNLSWILDGGWGYPELSLYLPEQPHFYERNFCPNVTHTPFSIVGWKPLTEIEWRQVRLKVDAPGTADFQKTWLIARHDEWRLGQLPTGQTSYEGGQPWTPMAVHSHTSIAGKVTVKLEAGSSSPVIELERYDNEDFPTGPDEIKLTYEFPNLGHVLHCQPTLSPSLSGFQYRKSSFTLLPVEIVADTNRDGVIDTADYVGKDQWSNTSGAIYNVNFDRDMEGTGPADAITWWQQEGVPLHESWTIENTEDCDDITPFLIQVPDLPPEIKVYLTLAEQEDLHAVHIFPRIKAGQQAIWGGFNLAAPGKPWSDPDANPLDIEITEWLRPQPGENGHTVGQGGTQAGAYQFGLEGLVFRGMAIPHGTLPDKPGRFSGVIEIGLAVETNGDARQSLGSIKLKVAPFLLTPNHRETTQVHVANITEGLQGIVPSNPVVTGTTGQWTQDHVEIGHTQRPGGPLMITTLVCPYLMNGLADWPKTHLWGAGKNVFTIGGSLDAGADPGNSGGNIELAPPRAGFSLGRIISGNAMEAKMRDFLTAQEVQEPVFVDISYTDVGHIDEVMSFGPGGVTFVASPAEAITLLQQKFDTVEKKLQGVFFSTDNQPAKVTSVFSANNNSVTTVLDYQAAHQEWQPYVGGYLRVVTGSDGGGQVARIAGLASGSGNRLMIQVDKVWKTTTPHNNASNRRATQPWHEITGDPQQLWHVLPPAGAYIVAVKGTKSWLAGCPAIITVGEVLSDTNFVAYNGTELENKIQQTVAAAGVVNAVKLPALFYRKNPSNNGGQSKAFTPNPANLQWVNSDPNHPRPFGPRLGQDDVIEKALRDLCPGTPVFLDCWTKFHILQGEVHCGSAAERTADSGWWNHMQ